MFFRLLSRSPLAVFVSLCLSMALAVACGMPSPGADASVDASTGHRFGGPAFAYPIVPPGGHVGDLYSLDGGTAPQVNCLQGVCFSGTIGPNEGWFLNDAGTAYIPGAGGGGGSFTPAGDLAGTSSSQVVIGWQGMPLSDAAPANNSTVEAWNTSQWAPRQLTQDDILPGFAITSFTGGSTVEVGATVTNPAFTAAYSSTPASAQITNTDSIDSPLTLNSPFTSGTVVGSFSHSAVATVVFTLTATAANTKTATSNIAFLARTFSGLATAGATGATASGTTAVLVGATGTLAGTSPNGGLFSSIVGQSFGQFNPSGQYIDLLTLHTSSPHTAKDQNGFGFPWSVIATFSFTNANGSVLSMDLYQSTNALSTPFTLTITSKLVVPKPFRPLLPANDNDDLQQEVAT